MLRRFAAGMLTLAVVLPAHAKSFQTLHAFAAGKDGSYPEGGVVRDHAGNLYGTTYYGGSAGDGTAFRITRTGKESILHSFAGGKDGANPVGSPTHDGHGNLYGATASGGSGGSGTVFRITAGSRESILHAFTNGTDGGDPVGELLIQGGKLYGVAAAGGAHGAGAVFRVTTAGKETVLYSFTGGSDGYEPFAGVNSDGAGNLYGTTYQGGANNEGAVYVLSPQGTETVLYSFSGQPDGEGPAGPLMFDSTGNLYGTTELGGTSDAGTVFRIATDGTESVLYSFGGGSDGANPQCGLVMDGAGNLYGAVPVSVPDGDGDVFKLGADGTFSVLHAFSGRDGAGPQAGLVADAHGSLYGTAPEGGTHGYGVVFTVKE